MISLMWIGTILAVVVTALTWLLAHGILQSLARYGEKLEAVVSVIAIGILLLIMNWFFHKTYWTSWLTKFHSQKRKLLGQEAGLWLGLVTLGFTSVYREGFEIVLFLQALVLEGGVAVVLIGVLIALAAVVLVGALVFRLQKNLPYMKILIITGVMIGSVLLQMVGSTVHIMQVVGWLPIHVVAGVAGSDDMKTECGSFGDQFVQLRGGIRCRFRVAGKTKIIFVTQLRELLKTMNEQKCRESFCRGFILRPIG